MQIVKSIVGQSLFQLGVMYALVYHSDSIFGVPNAATMDGPSVHGTLVFNSFVLMQLFNQVTTCGLLCSAAPWCIDAMPWVCACRDSLLITAEACTEGAWLPGRDRCGNESREEPDCVYAGLQVNARKIYDEPNVLEGILANKLFLGILGAEAALQVSSPKAPCAKQD